MRLAASCRSCGFGCRVLTRDALNDSARSDHGRRQTTGQSAKGRFRQDRHDRSMPVCERLQQRDPALGHCHTSGRAAAWSLPDVKEDTRSRFVGRVCRVVDEQSTPVKRRCPHGFFADGEANCLPR
jgi:hypothetical protein